MDHSAVIRLMGDPTSQEEASSTIGNIDIKVQTCEWKTGVFSKTKYRVVFSNNKVTGKAFGDLK